MHKSLHRNSSFNKFLAWIHLLKGKLDSISFSKNSTISSHSLCGHVTPFSASSSFSTMTLLAGTKKKSFRAQRGSQFGWHCNFPEGRFLHDGFSISQFQINLAVGQGVFKQSFNVRIAQDGLVTQQCGYAIYFQNQNALVSFGLGKNALEIFFGFRAVEKWCSRWWASLEVEEFLKNSTMLCTELRSE